MLRIAIAGSVVALTTGCGRVDFVAHDASDRPKGDGDAAVDAAVDADEEPTSPFTNAHPVTELFDGSDNSDPSLTRDMLEIYFSTTISGISTDMLVATRATTIDAWNPPTFVTAVNTPAGENTPGISADGLTLWFASNRAGTYDIYVTTRTARNQPWAAPILVPELNSAEDEFGPEVTASSLRMVFYRNNVNGSFIYETTRATTDDPWGPPIALDALDTSGQDRSPMLRGDNEILFLSVRQPNVGVSDIFRATRASPADSFTNIAPVDFINSPTDEDDPWLSPDGRDIFWTSDRLGMHQIFEATR